MKKTLAQILEENDLNGPHGTDKNTDHDYINAFYDIEFKIFRKFGHFYSIRIRLFFNSQSNTINTVISTNRQLIC